MIFEGVKLMFVGMATVLLFLSFMILLIQLISHLTRGQVEKELKAMALEREKRALASKKKKTAPAAAPADGGDDDIAAIAAAVAAYEAECFVRS